MVDPLPLKPVCDCYQLHVVGPPRVIGCDIDPVKGILGHPYHMTRGEASSCQCAVGLIASQVGQPQHTTSKR